nr:MAG TPA: hypothetical protein [Bacteriophage sp.]
MWLRNLYKICCKYPYYNFKGYKKCQRTLLYFHKFLNKISVSVLISITKNL